MTPTAEQSELTARKQELERIITALQEIRIKLFEMASPLNAVIGFSELMRAEHFGPIGNKKYRPYVADVNAGAQSILVIKNCILDILCGVSPPSTAQTS